MIARHVYCCCQPGAESPLKREALARSPGLRLGFSRPGFVTFKLPSPTPVDQLAVPRLAFARAMGAAIGPIAANRTLRGAVAAVWEAPQVHELRRSGGPLRLHVWQRDTALPGHGGFEPGPTELSRVVYAAVKADAPTGALATGPDDTPGQLCLDVVLVEPSAWWLGCHRVSSRVDRWPGGVPPFPVPPQLVSRAYLKMREALAWGRPPAERGDLWVELGCAPGGASQALLAAGMRVTGVDPAGVDERIASHPRFRHLRMRAGDARRREFRDARWLAADINAAPGYTLDAAEALVTPAAARFRGLVLTLKLPTWELAAPDEMLGYFRRIRGWGYRDIRARQLAFNRREVCIVALRSRGQRRVRRAAAYARRPRPDAPPGGA